MAQLIDDQKSVTLAVCGDLEKGGKKAEVKKIVSTEKTKEGAEE